MSCANALHPSDVISSQNFLDIPHYFGEFICSPISELNFIVQQKYDIVQTMLGSNLSISKTITLTKFLLWFCGVWEHDNTLCHFVTKKKKNMTIHCKKLWYVVAVKTATKRYVAVLWCTIFKIVRNTCYATVAQHI